MYNFVKVFFIGLVSFFMFIPASFAEVKQEGSTVKEREIHGVNVELDKFKFKTLKSGSVTYDYQVKGRPMDAHDSDFSEVESGRIIRTFQNYGLKEEFLIQPEGRDAITVVTNGLDLYVYSDESRELRREKMENMLMLFLLKYVANNIGDRDLESAFDLEKTGNRTILDKECKVYEGREFKTAKRTEVKVAIYDGLILDTQGIMKHMKRNLELKATVKATDLSVRKIAPFRMKDVFSMIESNEQKISKRKMTTLEDAILHLENHSKVSCNEEGFFTSHYCTAGVKKLQRMMKYKYKSVYRVGWGLTNDGRAYEYRKTGPNEIKILEYTSDYARNMDGFYYNRVYSINYPSDFDFYDDSKENMRNH